MTVSEISEEMLLREIANVMEYLSKEEERDASVSIWIQTHHHLQKYQHRQYLHFQRLLLVEGQGTSTMTLTIVSMGQIFGETLETIQNKNDIKSSVVLSGVR